jgi:hypothetical protein
MSSEVANPSIEAVAAYEVARRASGTIEAVKGKSWIT